MKKLKTLFSPRKLAVWLLLLTLAFTLPAVSKPALSETDAIVTMLCVDRVDDNIELAMVVLTPVEGRSTGYEVYTSSAPTIGVAVDKASLSIGKDIGFAQCEIVALGANICEEGVMQVLDYMTRTKKVGRNTILIECKGDIVDFAKTVKKLNVEQSLKLENIINYDSRYVLAEVSNIENFICDYYEDISVGFMPVVKLQNEEDINAIEVASIDDGNNLSSAPENQQEEKKYILNSGEMTVFKHGKSLLTLTKQQVIQFNIFTNNAQKGTIIVEHVTDDIYTDATVVINVVKKTIKVKPSFENNKPVYDVSLEVTVVVDEVKEDLPTEKLLVHDQKFLSDAVIEKIKERNVLDMSTIVKFCKENEIDLIGVYQHFYALQNKPFEEYLKRVGKEKYLDEITFNYHTKVSTEY
ncbi:MAG: Ger(x)C family spore germination C-terminal domain-containing protein [Clostridia bacterium]|nr:Ger(x)C family spore germination C-terminal domain-containing protein [Clostridia bacterium]